MQAHSNLLRVKNKQGFQIEKGSYHIFSRITVLYSTPGICKNLLNFCHEQHLNFYLFCHFLYFSSLTLHSSAKLVIIDNISFLRQHSHVSTVDCRKKPVVSIFISEGRQGVTKRDVV
jgi:hypothetical protein